LNIRTIAAVAVLAATGCAVGPDYKRADVEAPERYRFDDLRAVASTDSAWWAQFGDPQLERLIAIALAESKDILIAAARVEEFYGRYGVQRGQQFPQAGLLAQGERRQVSRLSTPPIPEPASVTRDLYSVDLGVSFEIDLWGRLRRASEAARADLLAAEENRRTVVLSLVSAVATAYINLLDLDWQLEITRQTARTRAESVRIFSLRFKGGTISEMELQQVMSEYEAALAAIPLFEKRVAQQEAGLSVLIGRNPGISQTALSLANGRDKSTLTPVLNDLVRRGLVRRVRTPDDRRTYQLALTAAGERMLKQLAACAVVHDRNLDRIIGRRDRAHFLSILRRIEGELLGDRTNGRPSRRG